MPYYFIYGAEKRIYGNQVINKRSKTTKMNMLKESGSDIINKQDIANTLKAYFCSVCKDLASKIEAVPNTIVTGKYYLNPHCKYLHFKTIGVQDIREAMINIKISNSLGSEKISSYF